jgi:uncharacterized protein
MSNDDEKPAEVKVATVASTKISRFKRELSKFCLYCLLFYIFLGSLIAFSPLCSLVILRPQGRDDMYNAKIANKEEIKFANTNGDTLHAWFIRSPGSKRVALVHHGNAGNIINRLLIARDFLQLEFSVFLYDYRGYGESTGKPTVAGLIEDGQAAYDYVSKKLGYKPEDIISYGESIGTGVACRVAQDRPCRAIVLQSGLYSLPEVAHDGFLWLRLYPAWVFPQPRLDSYAIIGNLPEPILFIHGKKDRMIPCHHSQDLFALAKSPGKEIVLLPNAGHNDVQSQDEPQYFEALSKFVKKVFGEPAATPSNKKVETNDRMLTR